jgi:hypothetical protein
MPCNLVTAKRKLRPFIEETAVRIYLPTRRLGWRAATYQSDAKRPKKDSLRGGLRDGDQNEKVFYAKITTQRCVTIGGLTDLRGFHPVRHTPIGPEASALPKASRHTAFINSQPTIACPSRVIKNPFNMRVKGESADVSF